MNPLRLVPITPQFPGQTLMRDTKDEYYGHRETQSASDV